MELTAEEITNNPLMYYELDNESRNLSDYHVHTRCAFEGYASMDEAQNFVSIMQTHNLNDDSILEDEDIIDIIDSSNFQTRKLGTCYWSKMTEEKKKAWKERADRLNNRPLVRQVEKLPYELATLDLTEAQMFLRKCLGFDLFFLNKMIKRSLRNENLRELCKKSVMFPYSIDVQKQVYRTDTLSSLLLHVIFGENIRQ